MTEENKAFLRDGVRFATIVGLMIACLIFLVIQWTFPRPPKMDQEALNKIEGLTQMFAELKEQNAEIIKTNTEANGKLGLLLKSRETQRDDTYQELLERYKNSSTTPK